MFKVMVLKEIKDTLGSKKFIYAFLVSSLLIILSFYVGARWYETNQTRYEIAVAENLRQMSGITDWINVKHHVFLPPNPLAALVTGIDNDIGRNVEMSGVGELKALDSRFSEDPIFAVFYFMDLTFIFTVVLALFAVLFGYNMINGEKEAGTLRLVFANALPRDKFILGKMSGALTSVLIPLMIPVLLGCLILIMMNVPMDLTTWFRLSLIILAGMLYFSVFLLLAIFLSALTKSSMHSFLLGLIIWIFATLIIPRASVLLAGRAVDVPSVDELDSQKFRYRSQLWSEDLEKMNAYQVEPSDNPQDMIDEFHQFMGELSRKRNEKTNQFNQRLNEERRNKQNLQETLAFIIARISPSVNFSLAVMHLAGTSIELKQDYLNAAQAYQQNYARFLSEKTDGLIPGSGIIFRTVSVGEQEPEPINPNEIPVFEYKNRFNGEVFHSTLIDFTLLILFNIVFFNGAYVAFLRYDLR